MKKFLLLASAACVAGPASAEPLKGRAEANWRYGHERSILMTELWAPIVQGEDDVFYGDLRLMGDDQENREGNFGLGYRHLLDLPLLGDGVAGVHGWIDRRLTERGSRFYQSTFGAEWMGEYVDFRVNGYVGLSDDKKYGSGADAMGTPFFAGSGIFVDIVPGVQVVEEIMDGADAEIGFTLPILQDTLDNIRVYAGGYHFTGDYSEDVTGWRTRFTTDITSDVQIGARFQSDDARGSQGFLEATVRFPFGNKKSMREHGIRARLDESPERDIDIVTGAAETSGGSPRTVAIVNTEIDSQQRIIHVDNTGGAGDGSSENPFGSLQDAEAAALAHDIIYLHRGDGTSAGQDSGITLAQEGLTLIGSGSALYLDSSRYAAGDFALPARLLVAPAGAAPVISNGAQGGDGITVTADAVSVSGVTVSGADRYGIAVIADGAGASATNVRISNVTATANRTGIYVHGANGGAVGASVEQARTFANSQHGISVYDDTAGAFEVDLGGGALGSAGQNVLSGNTLEDLSVDYDGGALSAQGNWWGQAGGPQAGQIYFGAPIEDGLVGHWLLDETSGTSAASRIGSHTGTYSGSPTPDAGGINDGALSFDRVDTEYVTVADYDATDTGDKLTVSYWVNPDTIGATDSHILKWEEGQSTYNSSWGVRAAPAADELIFFIADGNFDQGNNYFITSDMDLAPGTWTNITFVYDGAGASNADRLKIYKNGVQVAGSFGGTIASSLNNTNEPITMGRRLINNASYANYLDGRLDDVRIYSEALTAGQVGEITRSRSGSTVDTAGARSAAP